MADVESLVEKISSDDPNVRTAGWQSAGDAGAPALRPLAKLMIQGDLEVGRAAKRGLWQIVRTVGAPDAEAAGKRDVISGLLNLLANDRPASLRREVLWMLSEIAGDESVDSIAALLKNRELREDARMVLDRIPGEMSLAALQSALTEADDDFKHNIAQSLRHRGVDVEGVPCRKLVPTKTTNVKPIDA